MDDQIKETSVEEVKTKKAKKSAKKVVAKKADTPAEPKESKEAKTAYITVFKDAGIKEADTITYKNDLLVIGDRNKRVAIRKIDDQTLEITATQDVQHNFKNDFGDFYSRTKTSLSQLFFYGSHASFRKHVEDALKVVKTLTTPATEYEINDLPRMWDDVEKEIIKW